MNFLLDRYRRSAFNRYFEGLEPIDRATFWIASLLALISALCFSANAHS